MPIILSPNTTGEERLLSPVAVIAMVLALSALLVLLFPGDQMAEHLAQFSRADELSITYLRVWLRLEPFDLSARLLLARHLRELGQNAEARQAIAPMISQRGPLGSQARLLSFQLSIHQWSALGPADPQRATLGKELIAGIETLMRELEAAADLKDLAVASLWLDQPSVAARIYHRLVSLDPKQKFYWLTQEGKWHLAAGQPRQASAAYELASRAAASEEDAVKVSLDALDAMRAADDQKGALWLARAYVARFPNRIRLLDKAVAIAREANQLKYAEQWIQARVSLDSNNDAVLKEQLSIELAFRNIHKAFEVAEKLVRRNPGNALLRERLAELSEWVGRPRTGLVHWMWLARRVGSKRANERAFYLAKALWNWDAMIALIDLQSRRVGLRSDQLEVEVNAFEEIGDPQRADALIQNYLRYHPDEKSAWRRLAQVRERKQDLEGALIAEEEIGRRFGSDLSAGMRQARLLWRLRRPAEALSRLRAFQTSAPAEESSYWQLLGELAWAQGDRESAERAYRVLWKRQEVDDIRADRLVELVSQSRDPDEVVPIAEEAWNRHHKATFLLRAMEGLARKQRWASLGAVIRKARTDEALFVNEDVYWISRGQWEAHQGHTKAALAAYRAAVEAQPGSSAARAEWLSLAIAQGDRADMAGALQSWAEDANSDRSVWPAVGEGLARLGREQDALEWFQRNARVTPDDLEANLALATALEQAGLSEMASRVHAHSRKRLRSKALAAYQHPSQPGSDKTLRLYAAEVRQVDGAASALPWIQPLLRSKVEDAEARELAVASYLEQQNMEGARHWRGRRPNAGARLALALADDDRDTIAYVLQKDPYAISTSDRIVALRRLERNDEALKLASEEAGRVRERQADVLYAQTRELRTEMANTVSVASQIQRLGVLNLIQVEASDQQPISRITTIGAQASYATLNTEASSISNDNQIHETELILNSRWHGSESDAVVGAGVNLHNNEAVWIGRLSLARKLDRRLAGGLSGAWNEKCDENAALRAQGTRGRLEVGLDWNWTRWEVIHAEVGYRQYQTRTNEPLAKGILLHLVASERLSLANPDFRVRAEGSLAANHLAVAPEVGDRGPRRTPPEQIIPATLGTAGLGIFWSSLLPTSGVLAHLKLEADLWGGWIGPPYRLGYNVHLGVGTPVFGLGDLSLAGFYGTYHGSLPGQTYLGIGLTYVQNFLL